MHTVPASNCVHHFCFILWSFNFLLFSELRPLKNQSLPLFAIICIAVGVCGAVTIVLVCLSCVVIYKRHKMRRQLSKVFVVREIGDNYRRSEQKLMYAMTQFFIHQICTYVLISAQ